MVNAMRAVGDLAQALFFTFALAVAGFYSNSTTQGPADAATAMGAFEQAEEIEQQGGGSVNDLIPILDWAIRQGGFLAVLVTVLYFYRRDMHQQKDEHFKHYQVVTDLVHRAVAAQTDTAAAIRENAMVLDRVRAHMDRA